MGQNSQALTAGPLDATRFVLRGPDGSEAAISELRDSFRQGFVFEILDTETGRNIKDGVFVLVLNPVRYNLSEPFQKVLTPAEDDTVVAEENGIILRTITLEGTFGLKERRASGFVGAQGNGEALGGNEHFNLLRNFFRRYSAIKKDPRTSARHVMIFHALRDDDHFVLAPEMFETPRDAGRTRTHYEYRIQLTATDEATKTGLFPVVDESSYKFTDTLRGLNEAFNDARSFFAEVTANLSEIRRKVQNIQTVLINAAQVINAVGGVLSGASEFVKLPLRFVANTADLLANAGDQLIDAIDPETNGVLFENARSLRRLEASIDRIAMFDERFEDSVDSIEDVFRGEQRITAADASAGAGASAPGAEGSGGATIGSRVRSVGGSDARYAGLDIPRGTGLREVYVERTDTLESLATAAGTVPEAIILINDLRPPYLTAFGGPGILKPGDVVLVPDTAPSTEPSTGRGQVDYLTTEEALYGIDLGLDQDLLEREGLLDIAVDDTHDSLDAELARGLRSVIQGTEITINTERGTTLFLPDIGIRRNVGTKGTAQHVLLASIILRESILADPRVDGIQSARVVFDGNTGALSQEITPILSGQQTGATFVLPFGRASGGS